MGKVKGGATKELDEKILRMLRQRDNLAIPRGPKWLPQVSQDVTSLGSGTNLTIASGIAVGFLCLQRRIRAAGFLIMALGSGLMFCYLLKNFFYETGQRLFHILHISTSVVFRAAIRWGVNLCTA